MSGYQTSWITSIENMQHCRKHTDIYSMNDMRKEKTDTEDSINCPGGSYPHTML